MGPDTPAQGQGSGWTSQASLPQASLVLGKSSVAASSGSFLDADANPMSCSLRMAPAVPHSPNGTIPDYKPLLGAQPPSPPQGKPWAGISLPPTKGSSQTTGHTKENSEAEHQKAGLPPAPLLLELSGDIKWQLLTLDLLQSIL